MRGAIATVRYWLPLVGGVACLAASMFVGAVGTWILLIAAFGLLLDGLTAMWERAGRTGNLTTHRQ